MPPLAPPFAFTHLLISLVSQIIASCPLPPPDRSFLLFLCPQKWLSVWPFPRRRTASSSQGQVSRGETRSDEDSARPFEVTTTPQTILRVPVQHLSRRSGAGRSFVPFPGAMTGFAECVRCRPLVEVPRTRHRGKHRRSLVSLPRQQVATIRIGYSHSMTPVPRQTSQNCLSCLGNCGLCCLVCQRCPPRREDNTIAKPAAMRPAACPET